MLIHAEDAIQRATRLVNQSGTRDPYRIAADLGITILEYAFKKQKGVYKVIEKNRFIFIKEDLDPVMKSIVLLHEIGHDQLHRKEAVAVGGFQEFNLFDMANVRMEYEANIFASTISLPDDEILEYIYQGFDTGQIASAMDSDINLVALKVDSLRTQGFDLRRQDVDGCFLR